MSSTPAPALPAIDPEVAAILDELPMAYAELDSQGVIVFANRAARALQAGDRGELVGQHAWDHMPPDDQERSRAGFYLIMESGSEPPVVRRSLYTSAGAFRTHEMHRTLIRDDAGKPIGMRAVTIDVTEATLAHEEEHNARLWLESVLHSLDEAVIVTDALGFIRNANPAAEKMFGWSAEELTGQQVERRIPMLSFGSSGVKALTFTTALDAPCKGTAAVLDRDRNPIHVEISASPIVDRENGFTMGVVSVWRKTEKSA